MPDIDAELLGSPFVLAVFNTCSVLSRARIMRKLRENFDFRDEKNSQNLYDANGIDAVLPL